MIIERQHFTIRTGYITWSYNLFVLGEVNLFVVTERIESDDEVQDNFSRNSSSLFMEYFIACTDSGYRQGKISFQAHHLLLCLTFHALLHEVYNTEGFEPLNTSA